MNDCSYVKLIISHETKMSIVILIINQKIPTSGRHDVSSLMGDFISIFEWIYIKLLL